ncbi:MAG: hypothetical protein AAFV43_15600 [Planctomycetota bacterium]
MVSTVLLAVSPADAVWTKLFGQGDTPTSDAAFPGSAEATAFDQMRSNGLRDIQVSANGNYVGAVTTNKFVPFGQEAWYHVGSKDGGQTFEALRREATFPDGVQIDLSSNVAIDDTGSLFYVAELGSTGTPNSLWRDSQLFLTQGDAITAGPLSGNVFLNFTQLWQSPGGVEYWLSEYAATAGASDADGKALFRGLGTQQVLLQSGDSIGAGLFAEPELNDFANLEFSPLGTNYLTRIKVIPTDPDDALDPDKARDMAAVLNGQVISVTGGGILREGDAIPAAAGGLPNEVWSPGSLNAVNEAGDWIISASAWDSSQPDTNTDADFLVMNGSILHRDGDIVDGRRLVGLPSSVSLNESGDLAFVWGTEDPNETNPPELDALFLNGEIVLIEGDLIETDGNGFEDLPLLNIFNATLTDIDLPNGDPLLYFEARLPGSVEFLGRNTISLVAGDYNGDGRVSLADYSVWRDTRGSTEFLAADGNNDSVVDDDDYNVWVNAMLAQSSVSVPEPAVSALGLLGLAAMAFRRH